MQPWTSPLLALVISVQACSGAADPPPSAISPTAESSPLPASAVPLPASAVPLPASAVPPPASANTAGEPAPAFVAGGVRCLHYAPEGDLLSCEEISPAGVGQPSADENCAMLGGRLERGECPTANVVGRCLAMDGPDLEPVYPIRIHHYRSWLVATPERSAALCAELNGTFVPVP